MRANSVARRYARALFELAREKGNAASWLEQLEAVADATASKELAESLRSSSISEPHKIAALESVFSDLPQELRNLLRLLIARGRIDILPGICVAYREHLDELLGRVDAQVISARPLSSDEVEAIQTHLSERTGRTVTVNPAVDKDLIGGVIMRVGDEVIDASVATRLDRLRQRLA